jgi:hypothetical protein
MHSDNTIGFIFEKKESPESTRNNFVAYQLVLSQHHESVLFLK